MYLNSLAANSRVAQLGALGDVMVVDRGCGGGGASNHSPRCVLYTTCGVDPHSWCRTGHRACVRFAATTTAGVPRNSRMHQDVMDHTPDPRIGALSTEPIGPEKNPFTMPITLPPDAALSTEFTDRTEIPRENGSVGSACPLPLVAGEAGIRA